MQPTGTGYVIRTWYVDGSGNWLVLGDSSPTFQISAGTLPIPTVTQPSTAGPFSQGSSVTVAWNVAYATATGDFHAYAYKSGTYYWLNSLPATGAGSYSFSWIVTQPVDSGYVVRVWYTDAGGNWIFSGDSSPSFSITTGTIPFPTVTPPSTAGPFAQNSSVPVAWNVAYPAAVGSYNVYAYNAGSYYFITSQAATGASSYSYPSWTATPPKASGYVIRVWYVDGVGNWLVSGDSSPAFTINVEGEAQS